MPLAYSTWSAWIEKINLNVDVDVHKLITIEAYSLQKGSSVTKLLPKRFADLNIVMAGIYQSSFDV